MNAQLIKKSKTVRFSINLSIFQTRVRSDHCFGSGLVAREMDKTRINGPQNKQKNKKFSKLMKTAECFSWNHGFMEVLSNTIFAIGYLTLL
jgi:hypothetical protein